jgi:hypothetical protein
VDKFDRRACAEIRTADTDNDKNIAKITDLFSSLFDLGNFISVVVFGKLYPTEKIIAGACLIAKGFVSAYNFAVDRGKIRLCNKTLNIFVRKYKCHFIYLNSAAKAAFHYIFKMSASLFPLQRG